MPRDRRTAEAEARLFELFVHSIVQYTVCSTFGMWWEFILLSFFHFLDPLHAIRASNLILVNRIDVGDPRRLYNRAIWAAGTTDTLHQGSCKN